MSKAKTQKIIPRGKYILVKPDEAKTQASEHGVFKPDNTEEEPKAYGEVLAVGSEIKDIKKGDRVIFMALAGDKIEFEKVEYVLLHDDEVIALLKD